MASTTTAASSAAQTLHPLYEKFFYAYSMVRDALEGSDTVKRAGQTYLPIPSGMIDIDKAPASSEQMALHTGVLGYQTLARQLDLYDIPSFDRNPAYSAYLQRAMFPGFTANTYIGLLGLALKNAPIVELPTRMQYLIKHATADNLPLNSLYQQLVGQVLATGRAPLMLDPHATDNTRINIVKYEALSFINWKQTFDAHTSSQDTTLAVFEELVFGDDLARPLSNVDQTDDGMVDMDVFNHDRSLAARVATLNPVTHAYETSLFVDGNQHMAAVTPLFQDVPLTFIPLTVLGSTNNDLDPDLVPMKALAELAVQYYAIEADLRQSEFLSCSPTLIFTGVDADETPRRVGASVALAFSNPQARVFYTSTDTAALQHLVNHQDRIEKSAKAFGGNLLAATNARQAEAAEALRIRQSSAGATMSSVVENVSTGLTTVLKNIGTWMGLSQAEIDSIKFQGSKQFGDKALSAQEITALTGTWVEGGMSTETLVYNFQKGGLTQDGQSVEEEIARIEMEAEEKAAKIAAGTLIGVAAPSTPSQPSQSSTPTQVPTTPTTDTRSTPDKDEESNDG